LVQPRLSTQECACYEQIGTHKKIREIIKSILIKQQHTENINLNIYAILCIVDDEELFGIFFFRRMAALINLGKLNCIYQEQDYFDLYKKNPVFIGKINKFFAQFLRKYYEMHHQKITNKIRWVIECYGSDFVQEKSRYIFIKQFLESPDKSHFNLFLDELKVYVSEDDLQGLFKLETFKKQLNILYYNYTITMLKQGYWDGYAQYIIENIQYAQTHSCIYTGRIAWLNALLFNFFPYAHQVSAYLEQFPMIDFHMRSIQVPNDEVDLLRFFGTEFTHMKKIITQYLEQFEVYPSDRKLKLISRYLEDASFRQDEAWSSLYFKLSVYNKLHDAMNCIMQQKWEAAKQILYELRNQIIGYRLLLPNTKDKVILEQKLQYYETMLKILYKSLCSYFNNSILESHDILAIFVGLNETNEDATKHSDELGDEFNDKSRDKKTQEEGKGAPHKRSISLPRMRISPVLALSNIKYKA